MPLLDKLYFRFRHFFASRWPQGYGFCENHKSVVKFLAAGCVSGGADLVFLYFFHGLIHWPIVLATSVAFILSFVVSFGLQKFWTFRDYSQKKIAGQLFLYFLFAFISLDLNGIFMHFLVNRFHIWYLLSQFVVNLFLGLLNFLVYKFIIFKSGHRDEINHPQKAIA